MKNDQVELGDRVKDTISGLVGIAVAKTEWLNHCVRVAIQPEKVKDGKPAESVYLDIEQLVVVKKAVVKVDKSTPAASRPNGPRDNPTRPADDRRS